MFVPLTERKVTRRVREENDNSNNVLEGRNEWRRMRNNNIGGMVGVVYYDDGTNENDNFNDWNKDTMRKRTSRIVVGGGGGGDKEEEERRLRLQYMANAYCYRRVMFPLMIPCVCCVTTLPLIVSLYWLIDVLSCGYGMLSIFLGTVLTYQQLQQQTGDNVPPSSSSSSEDANSNNDKCEQQQQQEEEEQQQEEDQSSMVSCGVRRGRIVFVRAWLLSLVVCRWILAPMLRFCFSSSTVTNNSSSSSTVYYSIYTQVCLRWALGLAVLSTAVSFCFLGPSSIVQCSCSPLASNPMDVMIQYTVRKCHSWSVLMDWLASPNHNYTSSSSNSSNRGSSGVQYSKYVRPSILQCLTQMMIHAVAALLFSSFTVVPLFLSNPHSNDDGNSSSSSTFLSISSVLTAFTTVYSTYFAVDGTLSHEIIYRQHPDYIATNHSATNTNSNSNSNVESTIMSFVQSTYQSIIRHIHQKRMLSCCSIVPILSYLFLHFLPSSQSASSLTIMTWMISYATTVFLTIYFLSMDLLVRQIFTNKTFMTFFPNFTFQIDAFVHRIVNTNNNNNNNALHRSSSSSSYTTTTHTFLPEDLIVEATLAGFGSHIVRHVLSTRIHTTTNNNNNNNNNNNGQSKIIPTIADLQMEEIQRNHMAIHMVADAMLLPSKVTPTTTLEQDLLRIVILESMGGGGPNAFPIHQMHHPLPSKQSSTSSSTYQNQPILTNNDTPHPKSISSYSSSYSSYSRHLQEVARRLQASQDAAMGQILFQPIIVPVVRALCAYAGGLGQALITSSKNSYLATLNTHPQSWTDTITWSLPPAASASAEYSILAAARLLTLNHTHTPTTNNNNNTTTTTNHHHHHRYNRFNLLIPVVLTAAFRLRSGVLSYAQYLLIDSEKRDGNLDDHHHLHNNNTTTTTTKQQKIQQLIWDYTHISTQQSDHVIRFIARNCHDLRYILKACDDAATMILHTQKQQQQQRPYNNKHLAIQEPHIPIPCQNWLQSLQQQQQQQQQ